MYSETHHELFVSHSKTHKNRNFMFACGIRELGPGHSGARGWWRQPQAARYLPLHFLFLCAVNSLVFKIRERGVNH